MAEKLAVFRHDFTLIDCGGKDSIPVYIHLLNKFRLSYCAVYDLDHQTYKNQDGINSADISTQKIKNKVDAVLGAEVVFENDVEEEIGINDKKDKHDPVLALSTVSSAGFSMTEKLKSKITSIFSI